MPSALEHDHAGERHTTLHVSTPVKRAGYLAVAAVNIVLLWVSHQLLDWGWPAFLTDDFASALGLITASFIAGALVNLALAAYDPTWFRALTELITTWFGLAVSLRLLDVFPFDFSDYANDWSGAAHGLLILLIAVTGVAMVVNLVTLIAGSER